MKKTIPVIGMACSACSANVENKLKELPGVKEASVSLPGRSALVEYDENIISLEKMKEEIRSIGFDLVIESDRSVEEIERREMTLLTRKTILAWILSALTMCISMKWINVGSDTIAMQTQMLLVLAVMIYCGRQFYTSAWKQALHGMSNMDTLVALSTGIALPVQCIQHILG